MSNVNPNGSARYWFDGDAASSIDNGAPNSDPAAAIPTNNWLGRTNYWYRGTPQGFLQGGPGTVAESPQNISMSETDGIPSVPKRGTSYAMIL